MKAMQPKPRIGTLPENRSFYAWYLSQRRLARAGDGAATAGTRITQNDQQRETEGGQSREIEA